MLQIYRLFWFYQTFSNSCVSGVSPLGQRDRRDKRDSLNFYFFNSSLQYPSECCPFIKTFSYICRVRPFLPSDITYCESVFRKSFVENVEVFLIIRAERNNTHFRIDTCGRSRSAYPYPISIRVWGIVSSIYDQGLSTTFRKINESQLHTFFVYKQSPYGAGR